MKGTPFAKKAWLAYGMEGEDYAETLGRVRVLVLIGLGEQDRIVSMVEAEREVSQC